MIMPASIDPEELFRSLTGHWQGMTRTWFEPNQLADTSAWQGQIYAILGQRYLQYDYTGKIGDETLEGKAMLGYNALSQQFEMAWIDSFHQSSGIMHSTGYGSEAGISLLGAYLDSANGPEWGWRTEFILIDNSHLIISAYNITPDGTESLAVETVYTRR